MSCFAAHLDGLRKPFIFLLLYFINIYAFTIQDTENHCGPCMVPDGPIGGRESMEPWDHPRPMEGRRMRSGAIHGPHQFSLSRLVYAYSMKVWFLFRWIFENQFNPVVIFPHFTSINFSPPKKNSLTAKHNKENVINTTCLIR